MSDAPKPCDTCGYWWNMYCSNAFHMEKLNTYIPTLVEASNALAAFQARVAELGREAEMWKDAFLATQDVRASEEESAGDAVRRVVRESAAKDAALNAMREALERMLSEDLDWDNGAVGAGNLFRGIARAALSLEAVKLAADAQARRDEAVAEAVLSEVNRRLDMTGAGSLGDFDLQAIVRAALAKVKP